LELLSQVGEGNVSFVGEFIESLGESILAEFAAEIQSLDDSPLTISTGDWETEVEFLWNTV